MVTPPPEAYRRNVAVIVLNDAGEILACHRSDVDGAWQLPQGGIDEGESDEEAMYRELTEEIGTREVDVIAKLTDPIRYEWPEQLYDRGFRGQEQIYFLVRLRAGAVLKLDTHHKREFSETTWMGASRFLGLIQGFKVEAYRLALKRFAELHPGTIVS